MAVGLGSETLRDVAGRAGALLVTTRLARKDRRFRSFAAALVASIRFHRNIRAGVCAQLKVTIRSVLDSVLSRLLQPLHAATRDEHTNSPAAHVVFTVGIPGAVALGRVYGEQVVDMLLALS